uniref:Protein kinase domain-containing protein n=1 Tax=Strongyloides papillosus TaxID=174720 RepID=A0A0N5CCB8_STREA
MSILQDGKPIIKSPSGRFLKFDEELEKGTFKTVYRGLNTETRTAVAWCELDEDKFNKEELQKFKSEISMLIKFEHLNIEKFYDYWEYDDIGKGRCIVLIKELIVSGTLKLYIEKFKTLDMKIIKHWSRQILSGLNFLHTKNPPIIHRNLKCDNIFILAATGNVKIGNFGLSKFNNMALANCSLGTLEFIAPEMYDENYDEAVDVYAFGMCLLEMVTGEYPYSECNFPIQVYKKVTAGLKPDCLLKVSDKYPEVRDIIERCIRVNKDERMTIGQLIAHDFFASDDQYSVKIELKNKEDLLKNNTSSEIELDVTEVKEEIQQILNESGQLLFFSDYVDNTVENLMDQSIVPYYTHESDTPVLEENEAEKILEVDDDVSSSSTSSLYCCEKSNSCSILTENNINLPSVGNCPRCDKKTVKKGRFDVKTVNIPPCIFDENSKSPDVPRGLVENTEIGYDVLANIENTDISLYQSIENNNVVTKSIGMSKIDLASKIYTAPMSHQPELRKVRCTQSLSDEQINMLNGQIRKNLLISTSLQYATNKDIVDFSNQQNEDGFKISKTLTDDIPFSSTGSSSPSNTDNSVISYDCDKNKILPHDYLTSENRNLAKDLDSYIQNLDLGLRKLSRACSVTVNSNNGANKASPDQENVSTFQNNPKGSVPSPTNRTDLHSGVNIEELKYLLEMTQRQITLQQQMLMSVFENKASKTIDQCGSPKEDVNVSNNCGDNQLLDNRNQQKSTISTDDYIHQLPIQKVSLQMNGTSECLQAPLDNKKILQNTLSGKLISINNFQVYQQSDNLPLSQGSPHNSGGKGCVDEVEKKKDSTNKSQKMCDEKTPITIGNSRKSSVTSVFDENKKDCPQKNSIDSSNEEILRKLSLNNGNLVNLLSQEVEDVLNYQKSSNTKNVPSYVCKNSSYSCHSPEYHSIIDADLDVIEKESELYKIDKLVFRTLERHKKELLELRDRQCTELREIKHLSSLMSLKTQELINAIKSRRS